MKIKQMDANFCLYNIVILQEFCTSYSLYIKLMHLFKVNVASSTFINNLTKMYVSQRNSVQDLFTTRIIV